MTSGAHLERNKGPTLNVLRFFFGTARQFLAACRGKKHLFVEGTLILLPAVELFDDDVGSQDSLMVYQGLVKTHRLPS